MRSLERVTHCSSPFLILNAHHAVLGSELGYIGRTRSRDGDDRIRELTTSGAISYMPTTKRREKYRIQLLSSRSLQAHEMEVVGLGRTLVPCHCKQQQQQDKA